MLPRAHFSDSEHARHGGPARTRLLPPPAGLGIHFLQEIHLKSILSIQSVTTRA